MTPSRPPVRVLVVDDSATARHLIRALIDEAPRLEVCGEARNGREAVERVLALAPDIVTMDLQMPVMDGMEAICEIMSTRATRIVVVSDVADAANAMAAVTRGALEAIAKPSVDDGPAFTARLLMLAGVPVIRHLRPRVGQRTGGPTSPTARDGGCERWPKEVDAGAGRGLVAIAASTGGPQALAQLLPALPVGFPAPILVAQHISDGFVAGMAQWLDGLCPLQVSVARDGEPLLAGHVYFADSSGHLSVTARGSARVEPRAQRDIYHPSCDRLLCSVADVAGRDAIGVILTGMGRDGARGILSIALAGGLTLAQDEASSVVYGMNREAVASGHVARILPLARIAGELVSSVYKVGREPSPRGGR